MKRVVLVSLLVLAMVVFSACGGDTPVDGDTIDGDDVDGDTPVDGDTIDGDDVDGDTPVDGDDVDSVNVGNLSWQNPPDDNKMKWQEAVDYCDNLGSGWHLPTISELRSLIRGCPQTETGGDCGVTDSCLETSCTVSCSGCHDGDPDHGCYWPEELSGSCEVSEAFWSSSPFENVSALAWHVRFADGSVFYNNKTSKSSVRCVRSGT